MTRGFTEKTARMAGLAAAAKMTPEARLARANKASAAAAKVAAERRAAREELVKKLRKKALKKGKSEAEIVAELRGLGLLPKARKPSRKNDPMPSEDELEGYYRVIDRDMPGLSYNERKRQAATMLKADMARHEWKAR